MPRVRTSLLSLSLLVTMALGGCSGDEAGGPGGPGGPGGGAAAEACSTGDGQALRALTDDRSALPADNWVPVLATREGFNDTLALLDQASRGFGPEDLDAVLAATTEDRDAVLTQAVSDVAESQAGGVAGVTGVVRLTVADDAAGEAVGSYYRAALERLGARVVIERVAVADLGGTIDALPDDGRPAASVVLVGLAALAEQVGAELPAGGDASAQVQATATAALEQGLALGSTAAATGGAQVLVPDALVASASLVTISDLVEACDGAIVAVAGERASGAAEALAEAYGLQVGEQVATPADAFTGEAVAVVAVGS